MMKCKGCGARRPTGKGVWWTYRGYCGDCLTDRFAELEAENRWLRTCEEIKLVVFLSRPDVKVTCDEHAVAERGVVVHHEQWHFEGRAGDVISAARMAMHMERKYKAANAAGGD